MHTRRRYELVSKTLDHTVGLGTEKYNVGIITAQTFVGGGNTDGRFVTSDGWLVTMVVIISIQGTVD